MKRLFMAVFSIVCVGKSVYANELLPWQTENIEIQTPGSYSVPVDDRTIFFEVPEGDGFSAGRAKEVITRGGKYDRWVTEHGEYQKGCFGMGRSFYPLGLPIFGNYAQFSLQAKLHVKYSTSLRNLPGIYERDCGDFSKPEELLENLRRRTNHYVDKSKLDVGKLLWFYSPVEEVVINGRRWFHYLTNNNFYPGSVVELFVTGLASDRYLEIKISQHPVPLEAIGYPYPATGYPFYPKENQMPSWMKETHKYKEQVINSLRITKPEGSTEPDLYEAAKTGTNENGPGTHNPSN